MSDNLDRPIILCGLGNLGSRVFDSLKSAGLPIVVVDSQPDRTDPRLEGVEVHVGDFRKSAVLVAAGIHRARALFIVSSDDLANVSAALTARQLNADIRIVVRMFNQNLLTSLGSILRNTTALSVSALTAPILALAAVTGNSLGAFKLDDIPHQSILLRIERASPLLGVRLTDLAAKHQLFILGHLPGGQTPRLIHEVDGNARLQLGDRLIVCGTPEHLEPLLRPVSGEYFTPVRWAGRLRRLARTVWQAIKAVDTPMKIGGSALMLTVFSSTLIFRYGIGTGWAEGLYQTVNVIATGDELHGEGQPDWAKVFLSLLRLAGAALFAGFTAIFTNYLIRARLAGALETRKIPDSGHIVVCGLGNLGYRCVEELQRLGKPVVAVEKVNDNPFAATVRRMGLPVIIGDANVPEVLRQARVETARAVISTAESELANLEIALVVRNMNPNQRVIIRLTDPDFAAAVREAADLQFALSTPALAAPAFVAALFGDKVHCLIAARPKPLAVVELMIQADDPCLAGQSLMAAMIDYRFLPLGLSGQEPFVRQGIPKNHRLEPGERLTIAIGLDELDRLQRRLVANKEWELAVRSHMAVSKELLVSMVRRYQECSQKQAELMLAEKEFILADRLSRGEAEELLAKLEREKVRATIQRSES